MSTFDASTSLSTAAGRKSASSSASIASWSLDSISSRSSLERLELARRTCELVVERRQNRLLDLLQRRLGFLLLALGRRVGDLLRLARAHPAQPALDLFERGGRRRAGRRSRAAPRLSASTRSTMRTSPSLRGAVLDRDELGNRRAENFQLALDELLGHLRLGSRYLEPAPVGNLGRRLHGDLGREAERCVLRGRQLVVELRLRDRSDARVGGRVPEPAADVRLDGFAEDAVAPDARLEHLLRDLALAEARDLRRRREVRGGVLDGVLHVVARHLDLEADAVLRQLLDLRLHRAHHASRLKGWVSLP